MFLTPDTTAILVADRRSALESAARRRRTIRTLRSERRSSLPSAAAVPLPRRTDRTSVQKAA